MELIEAPLDSMNSINIDLRNLFHKAESETSHREASIRLSGKAMIYTGKFPVRI
jgi:hypothetical protein